MAEIEVKFYNDVDEELVKFVVIVCRYQGKWLWVKHRERDTYENPGGHREEGETAQQAAVRELQEETGALAFDIRPISCYSVTGKTRVCASGEETFGKLFYAEIRRLGEIHSEIERFDLFDAIPEKLTYPDIQPHFVTYLKRMGIVEDREL